VLEINPENFQKLHDFPAHVLTVQNFGCVWVELEDQEPYVGIILKLQHPEMDEPYEQLYRLHPRMAALLVSETALYLHPPEAI
jgi:hypothetical protein